MAVTATWYGKAGVHLAKGEIAWLTDAMKVILVGTGYTFDADAHESYNDVKAQEVANGNGYTTRGVALGSKAVNYDAANDKSVLVAANSLWSPGAGQTLSGRGAIIYKDSGTDTTSWLAGYVNFGATISAVGAPLTINWDPTDGCLYLKLI